MIVGGADGRLLRTAGQGIESTIFSSFDERCATHPSSAVQFSIFDAPELMGLNMLKYKTAVLHDFCQPLPGQWKADDSVAQPNFLEPTGTLWLGSRDTDTTDKMPPRHVEPLILSAAPSGSNDWMSQLGSELGMSLRLARYASPALVGRIELRSLDTGVRVDEPYKVDPQCILQWGLEDWCTGTEGDVRKVNQRFLALDPRWRAHVFPPVAKGARATLVSV